MVCGVQKMGPSKASVGAVFVVASLLLVPSWSHVALTFPPARKYDLDFLDNSRTKAPCGMPRGKRRLNRLVYFEKLNSNLHQEASFHNFSRKMYLLT